MVCNRRELVLFDAAAAAAAGGPAEAWPGGGEGSGYGLVSQIIAAPGRRNELAAVFLDGARNMPGCRA